jgi:hypothetical protein
MNGNKWELFRRMMVASEFNKIQCTEPVGSGSLANSSGPLFIRSLGGPPAFTALIDPAGSRLVDLKALASCVFGSG